VYYGEELGLEDAFVAPAQVVDPGGRDGCRAPLPWDSSPHHGWPVARPWLPFSPDPESRNVESLRGDESSILHLYRRVLAARRNSRALRTGAWRGLPVAEDVVLAYERREGDDRRAVLVNFSSRAAEAALDRSWLVEVDTEGKTEGEAFAGRLSGDQAVVLRPA
jgi:alpha-glucosidase